ncbi:formylglycine-generating enzyme family protein [Marinifilum sp. JC120]|nr:formylglycine-generating enzyme family protein [Marinifilum sp. JC120]
MLRIFSIFILLLTLAIPAHAVNPDEFIGLEFREQTQKKKFAPSPAISKPFKSGKIPKAGQVWTEPSTGMEFVWIPGGCFMMGSSKGRAVELPVHEVCVDGFWMGRYEVTNGQYRKFRAGHNSKDYKGKSLNQDRQPVVFVSWHEARSFADWLSSQGYGDFKLPTEAEWEYACRARTSTPYYFGETISSDQANYNANYVYGNGHKGVYRKVSTLVGAFTANAFGLYDMHGNVEEWCEDFFEIDAYTKHTRKNPVVKGKLRKPVLRGGSWMNMPAWLRSASRSNSDADSRKNNYGFRLIRKP